MAIGTNAYWQFDENRARAGYKSAWLVKEAGADKYSLVGLTNTVPYPFGDNETFDVNILQGKGIGKIEGKMSYEATDVPVYHHRDNAYRFMKMQGKVLDFMSINGEFVGYKFSGTLKYKPDSAEASESMATVTVTPLAGSDTPVLDARNEVIENLCLANVIPETIKVGGEVDFSVKQADVSSLTFKVVKIASGTNVETDATLTTDYTIEGNEITFKSTGLMAITISADGYASWTTTVYVEA